MSEVIFYQSQNCSHNEKAIYIYPAIEIHYFEVEQMIALSLQEGNATSDDALSKPEKWDDWDDEALWDE